VNFLAFTSCHFEKKTKRKTTKSHILRPTQNYELFGFTWYFQKQNMKTLNAYSFQGRPKIWALKSCEARQPITDKLFYVQLPKTKHEKHENFLCLRPAITVMNFELLRSTSTYYRQLFLCSASKTKLVKNEKCIIVKAGPKIWTFWFYITRQNNTPNTNHRKFENKNQKPDVVWQPWDPTRRVCPDSPGLARPSPTPPCRCGWAWLGVAGCGWAKKSVCLHLEPHFFQRLDFITSNNRPGR